QKFVQTASSRTPLVDVCNLPGTRFDLRATPKRHVDATPCRWTKLVGPPALSSLPSESRETFPSNFAEPVVCSRLQTLQDVDVGAETVLNKFRRSPGTETANDGHGLNDEQLDEDLDSSLMTDNHVYGDHTYPTSKLEDGACFSPNSDAGKRFEPYGVGLNTSNTTDKDIGSDMPSESLGKSPSNFAKPVLFSRLQNLEDVDVGAEIVLDKFGRSSGIETAYLLGFGDTDDRHDLSDDQLDEDWAASLIAEDPLFYDHTYPTSRSEDTADATHSNCVINVMDRCEGTDGAPFTAISAADKCIGPDDVCLKTGDDKSVGSDVPLRFPTFTDKCVETDASADEITCSQVDVSMSTEHAATSDCSVLAMPERLSQETMTETDAVDTASSMTPFKLGKHGSRITAEEVRRQHPRVVANQIDSVMLSNQRLEKQARSFERERAQLRSALKESKSALQERETTITEMKAFLEDNQKKMSQQEAALLEERMKCWNAEETLQSSLSELEKKCDNLERFRHEAELCFAEQLEQVYAEAEEKSYKKQFESAQQKIRELQAAEKEYAHIVDEVEEAYNLQGTLRKAVVQLKATASGLASDKVQLQNENENLKKLCVSKEVDVDVLRFMNEELSSENENMKELVAQNEQCITEMEGSLKASNTTISRLQEELSQCLANNAALIKGQDEMRRNRAIMIIKLSEQQDSETVALQALEEAEKELSKTEEALAKEKAVLAKGKQMHERMINDFEEEILKYEMEVQHLEDLLDKCELKRNSQEQELFECQEQLYTLQ
ncbi:hypothetical protein EGW08_020696, partial [Elysia chlorotica]